jgi:hypothetical protein
MVLRVRNILFFNYLHCFNYYRENMVNLIQYVYVVILKMLEFEQITYWKLERSRKCLIAKTTFQNVATQVLILFRIKKS